MRRKTVLLLAGLAPFAGGCNIYYYAAKNILNEPLNLAEQVCRHHDLRSEAKVAWQEVRMQYPRCMFTAEFRDGFLDGFSDYLDRGGNAQPPAVAPKKYSRNRYLNAEGHALIQDYFLGFQYGVDVALATDQRKYLTVPVLLPDKPTGSPKFNIQPGGPQGQPGEPLTPPRPVELRAPSPMPDRASAGAGKPQAGLVSRPAAPPAAAKVVGPTKFTRAEEPTADVRAEDRLPATQVPTGGLDPETVKRLVPIPAPPSGVPMLPENVPTPSTLDDLPMIPANHMRPEPNPVSYPVESTPAAPAPSEAYRKGS